MVLLDVAGHRDTHQSEQEYKHHEGNDKTIHHLGLIPGIGGFPEYGDLVRWHDALRVARYVFRVAWFGFKILFTSIVLNPER